MCTNILTFSSILPHQKNEKSSLFDAISIVQQIASAALYLHECGFIHSNISSHCILMSKSPNYVKLSSFELTTNVSFGIQKDIESKCRRNSKALKMANDSFANIPMYALLMRNSDKMLKDHYRKTSKFMSGEEANGIHEYSAQCLNDVDPQYLPYYVEYRRQLSMHNYQAPELLISTDRFVYPTRRSDVYSLTLLLWELVNYCVPFVIFNESELKRLYSVNKAVLPTFEEDRCKYFKQIFKYGTAPDPVNRSMTVQHFISLLEDVKFDIGSEVVDCPVVTGLTPVPISLNKAADEPEVEIDTDSVQKENIYENTEDIIKDIDAQVLSPEMMFRQPKRPFQTKAKKNSPIVEKVNHSPLNNITSSTLYRSILDFNKLLSPRRAANANVYERTSTLKKRKKASSVSPGQEQKSMKELFEFSNMDDDMKISPFNISNKLNENIYNEPSAQPAAANVIGPLTVREVQLPSRKSIKKQQTNFMDKMLGDEKSAAVIVESTPKSQKAEERLPIEDGKPSDHFNTEGHSERKQQESDEDSVLGIAQKNKIIRNTWLSADQPGELRDPPNFSTNPELPVTGSNMLVQTGTVAENGKSDEDNHSMPNTITSDDSTNTVDTIPNNAKLNVSIKIVRKQFTPDKSQNNNKTIDTDPNVSEMDADDSPSVLSRIKFWNSLESPAITPHLQPKSSEKRCEFSFSQTRKLPEVVEIITDSPPARNWALLQELKEKEMREKELKEINNISVEISRCLQANQLEHLLGKPKREVKPKPQFKAIESPKSMIVARAQISNELNNSFQKMKFVDNSIDCSRYEKEIIQKEKELMVQRQNVSLITTKLLAKPGDNSILENLVVTQRRNSVLETVKRIENGLSTNNPVLNLSLKKIENKLFNEKINNTDLGEVDDVPYKGGDVSEIREIQGKIVSEPEVENDANILSDIASPATCIEEEPESPICSSSPLIDSQVNSKLDS